MEPAFYRGDLLFLTNYQNESIKAGEILVFKVKGRDIPIVHRVIKFHQNPTGDVKLLTKGDSNPVDDRSLYAEGQLWVSRDEISGRARGYPHHPLQISTSSPSDIHIIALQNVVHVVILAQNIMIAVSLLLC
eukprot:Em0010g224a